MQTSSPSVGNLLLALIAAKQKFGPIVRDKENEFFHSKYADLDSVLGAVEPALLENDLIIIQPTDTVEGKNRVVTVLYHSSGEYIRGEYELHPTKQDPQGEGSALTYARRYCVLAILGLAPEDDDGNVASRKEQTRPATPPRDFVAEAKVAASLEVLANLVQAAKAASEWVAGSELETVVLARKTELEAAKKAETSPEASSPSGS